MEGSDRRSFEGSQAAAATKSDSDIANQGADIGPASTSHLKLNVRPGIVTERKRINPDLPRRKHQLLTPTLTLVGRDAANLDRAYRRWRLFDFPDKRCQRIAYRRRFWDIRTKNRFEGSITVKTAARYIQACRGNIHFLQVHHPLDELRRPSLTDQQHAGRRRIKRAGVSAFPDSRRAANMVNDARTGNACGFIDDENPIHRGMIADYPTAPR